MLGKVIKYENKSMYRILLPLYLGLLLTTLLTRLTLAFTGNSPGGSAASSLDGTFEQILVFTAMTAYILLIAGVSIVTMILIIVRFYKSCLGDEGYLTFTLPVKISTHIWGRVLISAFWTVISVIVILLSVFLLVQDAFDFRYTMNVLGESLADFYGSYGGDAILLTVLFALVMLISMISSPLSLYACAAIGMFILPKHKVLGGFVGYFILSVVSEIFSLVLLIPIITSDLITGIDGSLSMMGSFHFFMIIMLVYLLVLTGIYYVITHLALARRLNLE